MNKGAFFAAGTAACLGVGLVAVAYGDGPQTSDVAGGRVVGLRGFPIAAMNPVDGQVLTYSANSKNYYPQTPSGGGGGSGITGLTTGQLGVAGSATTLTSSVPFGLTGASTIVETTAGGLLTPSILPLATNAAIGGMRGDGSTITCTAGVCTASGGASGITGLTTGQVGIAGSATTLTSSLPVSATSGSATIVETGGGGKIANGFMTGVLACADLTNGATGCSTATGTSGATIPLLNGNNTQSGTLNVTGALSTSEIHGTTRAVTLTSNNYTAVIGDCGTILLLPTGTTPTLTLPNISPPNGAGCVINTIETTSAQYTPQAAAGGTLTANVNGFTKTKGAGAFNSFVLTVPSGSAATWVWGGDGA